jgi:hypothetical protein
MTTEWIVVVIGNVILHVLGLGVLVLCYRSVVKMGRDESDLLGRENPETRVKIDELLRSALSGPGRS